MDPKTATCDDSVMANIRISHSEDGVATIALDRPHKKNALSVALREEMLDALEHLGADDSVNCLIVTGTSISWSRWMRWVARRCGLRCRISKSSDWQESHPKSERKTEHDNQIGRDHAPAEYTVESGHQAHSDAQEQASEGIGKNVFGSGGLHVPPPRSLGRTRTGLVNLEMPNTEIMTSPTMIKMNASHHRGLRPGLSITLTEITPVHTAPPTPATLKPTSYLPGSVTGSMELGVNAPANEVLP